MGLYTVLMVIHSIIVLFLIMMILIQRTDSDGMGGLGGGGGNQFLTGRATANLLTRTTSFLAAGFMISSLVLAVLAGRITSHSIVDSVSVEESAPLTKDSAPLEATEEKGAEKAPEKGAKKADKVEKDVKPATPSVPKPE
ncbi:MAG: preprotein translocase subunit SecG [Proteobacteria bacterium]|nr:preprotein translocase subunit SecG [Pseudomonadota bacterium]